MPETASTSSATAREDPLTRITVSGFKSIGDEQTIEIAPLTVLAGANSAGKSSFLQPLLLMKQTLESTFDPGPLLLHGPNARFTQVDQLFSKRLGGSPRVQFAVSFARGNDTRSVTYGRDDGALEIRGDVVKTNSATYALGPELSKTAKKNLEDRFLEFLGGNDDKDLGPLWTPRATTRRNRCFMEAEMHISLGENGDERFEHTLAGPPLGFDWPGMLQNLIHVPGLRGNPEREYPRTAVSTRFPGAFDDYVASIIYDWSERHDIRLRELGEDLQTLGLTWKVTADQLDDVRLALRVGRTLQSGRGGAQDLVSLADVGFGVSQVLPVLVALRAAKKGQHVLLEQPELHLHPRAQYALGSILMEAASRGVLVIIETHSSLLLRSIQTEIARTDIDPRKVSMNWFERDTDSGFARVSTADVGHDGSVGEWPVDFDDVAAAADWQYLEAASEGESG
ncbi:AAA family ATPase [Demequina muriae]|uniref:AAA family ATPase n=1 Tax=Demequina muriae TaxID=3051664 RepID=A0ABT8GDW2_9MICO|nr:AAA family ATPase [Demequina sp. EGI L300058]MDN4479466.1 AAA family ATPase [Demequina sp. EGI L300058]